MWHAPSPEQEVVRFKEREARVSRDGVLMHPARLLQRAARKWPESIALIYRDTEITYRELYQRACQFADTLRARDIAPGARVLMCFENSPEFYVAYFAIWHVGAVIVPLNTFLHEKEFAHIVHDADPVLIVTSSDRVSGFTNILNEKKIPILTETDMVFSGVQDDAAIADTIVDRPVEELAALLYTSGTTGAPKGVMLSGSNIMHNLLQAGARLPFEEERLFGVLPLFHSFAQFVCVWLAIFSGSTVVVVPKIDRRLILKGLAHKPTIFLGVPALYGLLCLLRTAPLESVKLFISGGDALPDRIRMGFAMLYRRMICNGFGLTETSPLISVDIDGEYELSSAVGRPVHGVQLRVTDEEGNEVPDGQVGRLWVKGPNVMLGYYNLPELNAEVLKDGWFDTGDLVYMNRNGRIVIAGRLKDLIIHKGFNIYPQEVENILVSHPNVLRAAVVGKADEQVGEVVVAFVQLRQDQENIEKELCDLCAQHLAAYKIPRTFICCTEELKTTATGKVDKKVLRLQLAEQKSR